MHPLCDTLQQLEGMADGSSLLLGRRQRPAIPRWGGCATAEVFPDHIPAGRRVVVLCPPVGLQQQLALAGAYDNTCLDARCVVVMPERQQLWPEPVSIRRGLLGKGASA